MLCVWQTYLLSTCNSPKIQGLECIFHQCARIVSEASNIGLPGQREIYLWVNIFKGLETTHQTG